MRQLHFDLQKSKLTFGGASLKSNPKHKRPIDTKSAMHLTLKAKASVLRLPKTITRVNREIHRVCKKYDFTLYKFSNNFNQLHILLRVTNRHRWAAFIRELTGRIAQAIFDTTNLKCRLWLGRPFTRIIKGWGRNYQRVKLYIELNILEATKGLTRSQAKEFQSLLKEFAGT